jgi:hypothetical protein
MGRTIRFAAAFCQLFVDEIREAWDEPALVSDANSHAYGGARACPSCRVRKVAIRPGEIGKESLGVYT